MSYLSIPYRTTVRYFYFQTAFENVIEKHPSIRRLQEAGYSNVRLILDGHENLKQYIPEPLDAAVFNFGWLPGGDKNLTTDKETSIAALSAALSLLKENGMLIAVLYPGHENGKQEAEAVGQWAKNLPQEQFAVLRYGFTNRKNNPPYLLAFEKLRQK